MATGARYDSTPGYITSPIPFFLATAILASPFLQPLVSVRDLSFISFLVWPGLHTSSFGTGYRCS